VEIDLLAHDAGHFRFDVAVGVGQDGENAGQDGSERPLEDGVGESGLGPEVVVDQRLVDASLVSDLLGSAAGGAFAEEDGVSRVENTVPGFLIDRGVFAALA